MEENKIPTAEEFWIENNANGVWHSNILVEFAKLHVKAALKAASENAVAKENPADYGTGEILVDENSILNSYSLDNIK
jgi:antirestriction protein